MIYTAVHPDRTELSSDGSKAGAQDGRVIHPHERTVLLDRIVRPLEGDMYLQMVEHYLQMVL